MALILKLPVGGKTSGAGGGGSSITTASLNVFCQMEEPEIKEGIWIQSDKGYENVKVDSSIYKVGGTWVDVETERPNLYGLDTSYAKIAGVHNGNVYIMVSYTSNTVEYACYNLANDTITESSLPKSTYYNGTFCIVGDYLYRFGGYESDSSDIKGYCYRYSLSNLNGTPVALASNSIAFKDVLPIVDTKNNCIYLFGAFGTSTTTNADMKYGGLYKYDIATNTYTKILESSAYGGYTSGGVIIGDYIYVFSGMYYSSCMQYKNTGARKINVKTGEVTTLKSIPDVTDKSAVGSTGTLKNNVKAVAIGGNIYLSCSMSNKVLCYNTATDTYTEVCNTIPYISDYGLPIVYEDKIIFSHQSILNIGTKEFNNGDFIIQRTDWSRGKYETQFHGDTSYGENFGRICSGFDDAYLYTDGDFDTTLPTYYGDGTKWVKFKN